MTKKWIMAVAIAAALVGPTVARAHEGHAHKVMGTVSSVEGNHVMVKTTDGKMVMDCACKTRGSGRGGQPLLDRWYPGAGTRSSFQRSHALTKDTHTK